MLLNIEKSGEQDKERFKNGLVNTGPGGIELRRKALGRAVTGSDFSWAHPNDLEAT